MAIKIFIGTSPVSDKDAELALEYSLRRNTSETINITWMRNTEPPFDEFDRTGYVTPFSGFRWAIPELCNFEGKAIYLDVDIFNLRDISELWNLDMDNKAILGIEYQKKYEFSVCLMDCSKMKSILPSISEMKTDKNFPKSVNKRVSSSGLVGLMDNRWNSMDTLKIPLEDSWNIHFTRLGTQPWNPDWYKGPSRPNSRPEFVEAWKKVLNDAKNSVH